MTTDVRVRFNGLSPFTALDEAVASTRDSNLTVAMFADGVIDNDTAFTANSADKLATQHTLYALLQRVIALEEGAAVVLENWILTTGAWNDALNWNDTAVWKDSA